MNTYTAVAHILVEQVEPTKLIYVLLSGKVYRAPGVRSRQKRWVHPYTITCVNTLLRDDHTATFTVTFWPTVLSG